MISPHLHSFIDSLMAKQHVTAEDVKHLHRDLLPDGIPSHAVADALLALDRTLNADPAWAEFLTPAVVDFAVWGLRPTGVINAETANWLLTALTIGEPTPTALRILEEIAASAHEVDPALLLHTWRQTSPGRQRAA
jgi:hypothetical protein